MPAYFEPNNPVVLLSNAGAGAIVGQTGGAVCRFPQQVVIGLTVSGTTVTASSHGLSVPIPSMANVSGVPWLPTMVTALATEFFFLDPNNATQIATQALGNAAQATTVAAAMTTPADIVGTAPVGASAAWTANPWHPLFLEWSVQFYPILYGVTTSSGTTSNWTLDGSDYTWNGDQPAGGLTPLALNGRIILSPHAAVNLNARLTSFLQSVPNLDENERTALVNLQNLVQSEDSWDLLSQTLNGFNAQLAGQMPGVFISPAVNNVSSTPSLSSLIGDAGGNVPAINETVPTGPQQ
jgi:hypothetical protein